MPKPVYPNPHFLPTPSPSTKGDATREGTPAGEKVNLLDFSPQVSDPPAPARPLERLRLWKTGDAAVVLLVSLQPTKLSRHWIELDDPLDRRLVQCNGADCVVCAGLSPRLDEVLLLPVWDLLSEVGAVLEILIGATHAGALLPQIGAVGAGAYAEHRRLSITCLDKGRYSVLLGEPVSQEDVDARAGTFAVACESGEIDPASVIPQMDNATMIARSMRVRNALRFSHPEHPALNANPVGWLG